ncbi:hypothetical protein Gasu2_55860 [Galdieria sulphuraria]|uniref:Uncharacterized protein n=1 Tax=Galdieria sulphuraria TaxID=130081 RepID=M2WYP9_GALSU|nr:uncharacterized protein Gasu_33820 [Galdieria sulphuraria]EME29180.1 hypothetical protein Gasu_33820 [Galdieria sulphuraria]GJD11448.1 hypothetical protein Gasu2_55860 [Galdieria sulphuraria]|eukprot:XP_005705700.1 hypothetical protein Gasu_33820 [Galdieria sulphuraria]
MLNNCCSTGRRGRFHGLEEKLTQLCLQLPLLEYCFVITETGIILTPNKRVKPVIDVEPEIVFQVKQLATQLTSLVFRKSCKTIILATSQLDVVIYDVGDQFLVAFSKKSKENREGNGLTQEKLEELGRLIRETLWSD